MKTKKQVLQELIERKSEELIVMEVQERYLSRKALVGNNDMKMALAQTQAQIASQKELINFLEEVIKEK